MLSFTPHEQIVAVHLCLEDASTVFHEYAIPIIDPNKKSKYLKLQDELDVDHEKIVHPSVMIDRTPHTFQNIFLLINKNNFW
jgi:hypothetical protein